MDDVYSLPPAFYFSVSFNGDTATDTSFMEVGGIGSELTTESYAELNEHRFEYKLPVKAKNSGNLVLKRGIAGSDSPLVTWCANVLDDFLIPITHEANMLHSGLEQNVKNLLNAQPLIGPIGGLYPNGYLRYRVQVLDDTGATPGHMASDQHTGCTLQCELYNQVTGAQFFNVPVQSVVPAPVLPVGWNQQGSGRRSPATGQVITCNATAPGVLGNTVVSPAGAVYPVGPNVQAIHFQGAMMMSITRT